jgi:hypothetical protein
LLEKRNGTSVWQIFLPRYHVRCAAEATSYEIGKDLYLEVEFTLRPAVSRSVCLGVEPNLGFVTRYCFLSERFCLKFAVLFLWGTSSDERTGLQFAVQSVSGPSQPEPITIHYYLIWDSSELEGEVPVFISPSKRFQIIFLGTGSPLHRLFRLAGLRWRYSNPTETWRATSPYVYPPGTGLSSPNDRQSINHYVLASSPPGFRWAVFERIVIWHQEGYIKEKIFVVTIQIAACKACSATWNLGTNSQFALEPRKATENLDRFGRPQDLPDANWLLSFSPALNTRTITLITWACLSALV